MSSGTVSTRLRERVRQRAGGLCEYCGIPEWATFDVHQIDHIVPRRHGGRTAAPNLPLACACCNQFKGTDISAFDPLNGELVRLYPPRQQDWSAHFRFASIRIQGLSSSGRATTRHLRFNDAPRIEERRRLAKLGSLGARPPSAGI